MGFQSQAGQVGFKTQAAAGTYDDPGTDGVFMRLRSGSLGPQRDLLVPDPEIGGGRDVPDAYLGAVAFSGDYEFYARTDSIATLLRGAFGAAASDNTNFGTEGWATHTITPTDGVPLPWLSVEEAIAGAFDVFNYTDAKVNTFHLEADANGYLMGTAGLIARLQTAGNTKTAAPDWDTNPMLVGTNISVTLGGIALPAKSFSFDLTNNIEDDDFRLGSLYLGDVPEKRREVTAGFTVRPEDSAYWRQAVYGAPGATQPGGLVMKEELVVTAETYEYAGTSTTQRHSIVLTIPYVSIEPFPVEPSGDDIIEHDLSLRALRPDPAEVIATVDVVNNREAVA